MEQSKQSILVRVAIILVLLLGIGGYSYWHYVWSKPHRVFDRMIDTMLSTPSVTKVISQDDDDQNLTQTVQLNTSPRGQVHSSNVLDQGNGTVVTTENIGVPNADYIRYSNIKTAQKNAEGKDFNFSEVLGTWGKVVDDPESGSSPQLFAQTILGVVPSGQLTPAQRKSLLATIKKQNVYQVDNYDTIKMHMVNGRPTYNFDVTVNPFAYISLLKDFTKNDLGLTQLEQLDPQQYLNTPPLKFVFTVDVVSGELTKISYVNQSDPSHPARVETYGSYGARIVVPDPAKTIPIDDLQSRLQRIQ